MIIKSIASINSLKTTEKPTQPPDFIAAALVAEQEMLENNNGYAAEDVHRYLKARIAGANPARPEVKAWR